MRRTASSMSALVEHAAAHGLLSRVEELGCGHDEVVAGFDGDDRRFDVGGADLLFPDHPADVVPVGDEGSGEAPFAS